MRVARSVLVLGVIVASISWVAARTDVRKPSGPPQPPEVAFSEFSNVEMGHVTVADKFAKAKPNQNAAAKIDEVLWSNMRLIYPDLAEISGEASPVEAVSARTLVIEPHIEQIKFISGGARFWGGAMAGNSAVLMKVTFKDKATGTVIAEPEFYGNANAFAGSYSVGAADNRMLDRVAKEVCTYVEANQ